MTLRHLSGRGICDKKVLRAFAKVKRELFVPPEFQKYAYADEPLPIGFGQTISQPYTVALMTELLNIKNNHTVLEVGTGSGYQAAILSRLARFVYTIERIPELAERAKKLLQTLRYTNVKVITGDGAKRASNFGAFDRIIVTAAAHDGIPQTLVDALKPNGVLVIPSGGEYAQEMLRCVKKENRIIASSHGMFRFVPMISDD